MGSCGNSTIVDDSSDGSVVDRPLCSGMLVQFVPEQPSGSELACDVLDPNCDPSDKPDGCLHLSGEGCGSASVIYVSGMAGDLVVSECENDDLLIWGKTLVNDSESCLEGCYGQKNAIRAGSGGLSSEEKPQHGDDCEMLPEFLSLKDSSEDCVEQGEQIDEKSNIFPPEGDSVALVEGKNDATGLLTDASNNISAFNHTEMSLQSEHMTGLLVDCRPQDELDNIIRIADPFLEVVDKCDALCGEVDACKQITLAQSSEVPSNLLYRESKSDDPHDHEDSKGCNSAFEERERVEVFFDKESNIDTTVQILSRQGCMGSSGGSPITDIPYKATQLEQEIDNSDTDPHAEDVAIAMEPNSDVMNEIGVVDKESIIDISVQILSPQGCMGSSGSSPIADIPHKATQLEQEIDNSDTDPHAEDVAIAMGPSSDVMNQIVVETKNHMLPLEDNIYELRDDSLQTTNRKPFSSESDRPSVAFTSNISSKDMADLFAKYEHGSISSSSTQGNFGQTDNDGRDVVKVDCVTEGKCADIMSLPSQRNGGRRKSSRKTQNQRASRKSKKKVCVPHPVECMKRISAATRKKRSCLSKPARSSVWGNINGFFEQGAELGVNEVMCQRLGKARGSCQDGKANKNGASSSSLSAMQNQCSSTPRVRLRIKIGKRFDLSSSSVIPKVVDGPTSAYSLGTVSNTQTVASNVQDELPEDMADCMFESFKRSLDSDALGLNGQTANSHFDSTVMTEKSDGDVEEYSVVVPPETVVEALQELNNNRGIELGTSPDSEVINSIDERQSEGMCNNSVCSFRESTTVHVGSKRGKKKDKLTRSTNCIVEDESQDSSGTNNAKHSKSYGHQKNFSDAIFSGESITSSVDINASSNSTSSKELSAEPMPLSGGTEHGAFTEALTVKSSMEAKTTCSPTVDHGFSGPQSSQNMLPSAQSSGRKLPQSLKSTKVSKGKSNASDLASSKKATSRQRGKQRKPVNNSKDKAKAVSDQVVCEIANQQHTENGCDGNHKLNAIGKINAGEDGASVDASKLDSVGLGEQHLLPHSAWVRCDDCHKWRRISADLADKIEESNCTWTCRDSNDKDFADCSIPQEKSNTEINAELGLSDEEDAYEDCKNYRELDYRRPTVSQESTFTHISTNEFLHRSRKTQTIDEIMVCHCKPPPHGRLGCGDECLNRMLNIECVQGTCPCGDFCSNQQFQRWNYARVEWFKCGKKGYGLKAVEGISKGQFLIEYVGEVLDMPTYEARQRDYALKGHRHFYFMTLNGSEVIDASAKGNLGRFINHSCDPNCRTEKWIVNGEICIGLFALKDIKQDEEVTFDYNYVRVFGAAAKKCYCGSPQCRGYIGGDPLNSEVIVQGDSDEEFPEPVMLTEDGETEDSMLSARYILNNRDRLDKSTNATGQHGISEKEGSVNHASADSQLHSALEGEDAEGRLPAYVKLEAFSQQMEDVTSLPWSSVPQGYAMDTELVDKTSSIERLDTSSTTSVSKVLSDGVDSNRELKSDVVEDRHVSSESRLLMKTSRLKGSVIKGKVCANPPSDLKAEVTTNKLQVPSTKLKKVVQGSPGGRFEAVQEKLNELLDGDGGISKRKDATKGYLKLLLLTAATGDRINGEGIQSNRDLSMILEALLKTKSRAVLNDIINKNGLQMLHNMMKQYRRDFKKIPILRKLLKVLEYLAASKILGSEHINGGPPCRGMESFRESMLSLTEHDDKTVHQIARSFRDRWIRRPSRKFGYMERDDNRVKFGYMDRDDNRVETHGFVNCGRFSSAHNHRHEQDVRSTEAIDRVHQSMPVTTLADTGAHHQSMPVTTLADTGAQEGCSAPSLAGCETNGPKRRKRKSRWDQPAETNSDSVLDLNKEQKMESSWNISEDVPPGFAGPFQNNGHSGYPSEAVVGHPKGKYNSLLPISYGMPLSIVQQYGNLHAEIAGSWITAPGMPFSPFPPLPPYPLEKKDHQPSNATDAITIGRHAEEGQCGTGSCYMEDMTPSTTGTKPKDMDFQPDNSEHTSKRAKDLSYDLGKKYFRQHKWNNAKSPTWLRTRDFWGCSGSNTRVGMCSIGVVNVPNESNGAGHQEDAL